jgi:hypothetical protein
MEIRFEKISMDCGTGGGNYENREIRVGEM